MTVLTQYAITKEQIIDAQDAISAFTRKTPVIELKTLNDSLKHNIFFKLESLQETGSFKVRGVLNALLKLKQKKGPSKIVAYSTGNHGLALAWAAKKLGMQEVRIFLPSCVSEAKKKLAESYGATVIITKTRQEAEDNTYALAQSGYDVIPPSDNDDVIAGASTVLYESLTQLPNVQLDAAFVPIGGGSLSSGAVLARHYLRPALKIYAGEPANANDASISYKTGKIFRFKDVPQTVADGATTLGLPARTFNYVKCLDGIYEIAEREILYWATWFSHLSNYPCEPTSGLSIAAAYRWLLAQPARKNVLVIISGGNVLPHTKDALYSKEFLEIAPENFKI